MDTEGMLAAAALQFAQENDLIVDFLHRYIIVLDALEGFLHFVQFMVVRGKERTRLGMRMFVDILHDGPGNGDAVVGGSTAPQLVKKHQAAGRKVIQDVGRLVHLHHKRRLAHGDVVAGSHTGEYLVHQTDMRAFRRNETADLRHKRNQGGLTEQCRLTRHVGTGNDDNLLRAAVQHHIVGYVLLAYRKLLLDDRVTPLVYLQHLVFGDYGTDIIVFAGCGGKRQQAVQPGYLVRIGLNGRDKLAQGLHQLCIKLCFQHQYLVLGAEYLFLIFFQFLRNVTLGIDQCLLANPLLRHFILVHVAHFDIVTEHIVIADFQAGNARKLTLPLLYLQKIVLAGIGYPAQLVQLGIYAGFYHTAFINKQRRVVVDFPFDAVADGTADVQLSADMVQTGVIGIHTGFLNRFDSLQGHFQSDYLAGRNTSYGYFGDNAFQIAYQVQLLFNHSLEVGLPEEILHHVQPSVNGLHILQGKYHPTLQQAGPHRTDCFIYYIQQAATAVVHAPHQLQAAHRKLIQTDVLIFLYTCQRGDMPYLRMLRHNEVLQDSPRSDDTVFEMLHAEPLQVLHFKVFQQFLAGGGFRKHPVVQLERKELAAEIAFEHSPAATFKQHLFRGEVVQ